MIAKTYNRNINSKICTLCKKEKLLSDFYKNNYWCKECCQHQAKIRREKEPFFERKYHLKYKYNLSIDEYEQLKKKQNGKCAICGEIPAHLHLDHSHATKEIRGFLCRKCNMGIGLFNDDIFILNSAINYLSRFVKK